MLQTKADEAQTTDSNTEQEQIVLFFCLIPATLQDKETKANCFLNTLSWKIWPVTV